MKLGHMTCHMVEMITNVQILAKSHGRLLANFRFHLRNSTAKDVKGPKMKKYLRTFHTFITIWQQIVHVHAMRSLRHSIY